MDLWVLRVIFFQLRREHSISLFADRVYTMVTRVFQKNAHVVTIDGYEDVPANDDDALKKAVANQPVSIAIEAGGRDFQLYSKVSKTRYQ